MENKAHALAAGAFVLVVAALLVALAWWLTRESGERDAYELSSRENRLRPATAGRGALQGRAGRQGRRPSASTPRCRAMC